MARQMQCPECGQRSPTDGRVAGELFECPVCAKTLRVPSGVASAETSAEDSNRDDSKRKGARRKPHAAGARRPGDRAGREEDSDAEAPHEGDESPLETDRPTPKPLIPPRIDAEPTRPARPRDRTSPPSGERERTSAELASETFFLFIGMTVGLVAMFLWVNRGDQDFIPKSPRDWSLVALFGTMVVLSFWLRAKWMWYELTGEQGVVGVLALLIVAGLGFLILNGDKLGPENRRAARVEGLADPQLNGAPPEIPGPLPGDLRGGVRQPQVVPQEVAPAPPRVLQGARVLQGGGPGGVPLDPFGNPLRKPAPPEDPPPALPPVPPPGPPKKFQVAF